MDRVDQLRITIGEVEIHHSNVVRDLGVLLDKNEAEGSTFGTGFPEAEEAWVRERRRCL